MAAFKVLIAGAGLGGLTLAQSLARAGIDFEVFERDASPFDRPQGYRLHLDSDAISAAREVLSSNVRAVFDETCFWTEPYTTILGTDLSVVERMPTAGEHGGGVWPAPGGGPVHANADRATLRQCLLAGLDDRIRYEKALASYERSDEGVVARFSDGTTAVGNVLVGADGIRSAVRRMRAPHGETVDAGITAIYGRLPLERAASMVPAEVVHDIFCIASDDRKAFLGLGAVRFGDRPDVVAARHAPDLAMRPQDDYVVCIVGARHEFFPRDLRGASGERLRRVAAATIEAWPGRGASLIDACDPAEFFLVEMDTSVPCVLGSPVDVTLLGDAIHAMTPTLGRGANVAMRDGALLGRALRTVADGGVPLREALARYESGMTEYGFAVVREAARIGEQRMAQNPLPSR